MRPENHILLIAHAPLAQALSACAAHVFPDSLAHIAVLDVPADEPPEQTLAQARALLASLGPAQTLVLTDMFGATPCNVAQRLVEGTAARLLVGVNLSMLLRALGYRHESLEAMALKALAGGLQGIMQIGGGAALQNQSTRIDHDQDRDHHQQ